MCLRYFFRIIAQALTPTFVKTFGDQTVTVGQPLKLEAQVTGFPAPEIKWFKDGVLLRPEENINLINNPCGSIGLV